MRFSIEWNRIVDGNGRSCGSPSAEQDVVFDAMDTLESTLAGLGYRLVYTRREIVAQEASAPLPDTFLFNGVELTDLLGVDQLALKGYTADIIVRAALAAVVLERP
jgi:hypothetical protein